MFEGARRIALLIAGVATIGTVAYQFFHDPYMSVSYSIAHPTAPFVKTDQSCPGAGSTHYFTAETSKGRSISVNLCLLPMAFGKSDELLIPYKVDEKGIWGAASYSSEVSAYERKLQERFKIPPADEDAIEKEVSQRYWREVKDSLTALVVGLAIFGGVVWATGWIVRGFMGIPRGMDKRPE